MAGQVSTLRKRDKRRTAELSAAKRIIEEITHEHWVLLSEASKALSSTLDYHQTLLKLSELAVPSLADYCVVDLLEDDGSVRRVCSPRAHSPDPEGRSKILTMRDDARDPIAQAIRARQPRVFHDMPRELLVAMANSDPGIDQLAHEGFTSAMVVPMLSPRGAIGAITFAMRRSGCRYSESDLDLARQLASRAALAVENARLYLKEKLAVRARDHLLAVVSHELKNPVTTIELQAQLLRLKPDGAQAPVKIESILASTRRMQRIINDLLDLDQLDAGRIAIERVPCELEPLLHEAMELMQPLAQAKRLHLELSIPAGPGRVSGDPTRLVQVISNLVGNAIKFSPAGTQVRTVAHIGDGHAEIAVSDDGPGIAPENLDRVFERYWQDPKTAHLGSGLGLAIAKGIVELHGGRIGVQSQLGRGTKVWFTIPLAPADKSG